MSEEAEKPAEGAEAGKKKSKLIPMIGSARRAPRGRACGALVPRASGRSPAAPKHAEATAAIEEGEHGEAAEEGGTGAAPRAASRAASSRSSRSSRTSPTTAAGAT